MSPPTLTRLDPHYPMLWRDEHTVQFGLEDVVRVDVARPWVEPLLGKLRRGIRRSSFDVVAHGVGAPRAAARQLLSALAPVLVNDLPPAPPAWVDTVNVADGRAAERMRQALADEGIPDAMPAEPDAVAVVLVGGAAAAVQLAPYLREDIAHLPVGFEKDAMLIGPVVQPGHTPCLSCRDLHERERDAAWPLLHAQLVGRATEITAARIAHAASMVARVLRTPVAPAGLMVRITPDGRRAWRSVRHHAECQCLDESSRSQPGTETAIDHLAPPDATTTPAEFARPA